MCNRLLKPIDTVRAIPSMRNREEFHISLHCFCIFFFSELVVLQFNKSSRQLTAEKNKSKLQYATIPAGHRRGHGSPIVCLIPSNEIKNKLVYYTFNRLNQTR